MTTQTIEKVQFDDPITKGKNELWLASMYDKYVRPNMDDYVIISMNIKRFQYINLVYGRERANDTLKNLYNITASFLHKDDFIARIYADEYNIILKYDTMDRLLKHFLFPFIDFIFDYNDPIFFHNIYLSFGICFLKNTQFTFHDAQLRATITRKECIQLKNRSFSYDYFHKELFDEYLTFNKMTDCVTRARFDKEFIPYVQPKIDLKTEQIIGGEILLRWIDKDGKEIPLSSFLPVLNKNKDIYLVDLGIFDTICAYLHACLKTNIPIVPMSFNITNNTVFDECFLRDYLEIFNKYDIPVHYIEFEFMENIQFHHDSKIKEVINVFKEYGFPCSLDDFGSGYSSFNILLEKQIDVLKIDQLFFQKGLHQENKKIIKHIIQIAHTLGVKALSEGVETKEVVEFLKDADCDYVQGYYFYKPMPLEKFEELLIKQQKQEK